jgi:CBS domain-containing protein
LQRELHKSLGTIVADVMTAKPVTIEADRPIREAAKLMQDRNLRRLPVLAADGTLVGIITQTDIVRSLAAQLNATAA